MPLSAPLLLTLELYPFWLRAERQGASFLAPGSISCTSILKEHTESPTWGADASKIPEDLADISSCKDIFHCLIVLQCSANFLVGIY